MKNNFKYCHLLFTTLVCLVLVFPGACEKRNSHDQIEVVTIPVGKNYPTNCYLVWAKNTDEAMVIDPGFEHKRILKVINKKGLRLKYIVHTHGHYDHTSESHLLRKSTGAKVYIHPKQKKYNRITPNLNIEDKYITEISDGESIHLSDISFLVIHTPGHSPGSICLYHSGVLFSGDLLFLGTAGRTDFAGGNYSELIKSLTKRLSHIPDDTKVYPGHGEATNMGHERKTNPFILGAKQ